MLQSLLTQSQYFNPRSRMGSDQVVMKTCYELKISIHAPAWGATQLIVRKLIILRISIHAPAWGATAATNAFSSLSSNFNPRSRMGSDSAIACSAVHGMISIHAPAWGATTPITFYYKTCSISIHAPAWGATMDKMTYYRRRDISIHAPAWGATFLSLLRAREPLHFNPRSRMGSDSKNMRFLLCFCNFH